jgi:threonine-phosphate decarboxylase
VAVSVHGGNIYDFDSPGEMIDFSSNINPYGPPAHAIEAAKDAISLIRKYPDTSQRAVRTAFSVWLGVSPEEIVFGNGASELLSAAVEALRPRRVITTEPAFVDYTECARRHGVPAVGIPMSAAENFAFPLDGIEKIFSEGDLLIACQPNNPTGRAWTEEELRRLMETARLRSGWLLVDECFVNLTHPRAFSCVPYAGGGVIVLRAVTKDFSAPGLRIGFAISDAPTVGRLRGAMQPWPLNCVGEAFAVACASCPEPFLSESAQKIAPERARLTAGLETLGYRPYNSTVNFILVESRTPASSLYERLQKKRILIRRCSNFQGLDDFYFRIAVRDAPDNDALLEALSASQT